MTRAPASQFCFIVGSGPSLAGFDYESLRGRFVIALNNAAALIPFANVVFFGNSPWFEANRKMVLSHAGEKHRIRFGVTAAPLGYPEIFEWDSGGKFGLDTRPGFLRTGRTCGYSSINLATQLGAKRIVLLGFDFRPGGNPARPCADIHQSLFASAFDQIARPLKAAGVEVINASAASLITAFPKTKESPATFAGGGAWACA
jgi:hypothetical protein